MARKDNKTIDVFPILSMSMKGYPTYALHNVVIYRENQQETIEFNPLTMTITENMDEKILKIRIANDKVLIRTNKVMDNIQVMGMIELAKAQFIKTLFDESNNKTIVQN